MVLFWPKQNCLSKKKGRHYSQGSSGLGIKAPSRSLEIAKKITKVYKTLKTLQKDEIRPQLPCRSCLFVCNFWRTDRRTDRQTDLGVKAPSRSFKNSLVTEEEMPKETE